MDGLDGGTWTLHLVNNLEKMTYKPIEYYENKKRYAIVTPNPSGESKKIIVLIEHLSEILDEFRELDGKTYSIKIVDRTEQWVNQFQEL